MIVGLRRFMLKRRAEQYSASFSIPMWEVVEMYGRRWRGDRTIYAIFVACFATFFHRFVSRPPYVRNIRFAREDWRANWPPEFSVLAARMPSISLKSPIEGSSLQLVFPQNSVFIHQHKARERDPLRHLPRQSGICTAQRRKCSQ